MEKLSLLGLITLVFTSEILGENLIYPSKQPSNDWWFNTLIYQIYPMSFQDSNNDGIGDIKGNYLC